MSPSQRQCLFCSNAADSREHAWPQWLIEIFSSDEHVEVCAERLGEGLRAWRSRRPELVVKHLCERCNNGWMSNVENAVIGEIKPLLRGASTKLSTDGQHLVSVWALKTAMVLEALGPSSGHVYTQNEREEFAQSRAIPWRTSVWLGTVTEATCLLSAKHRHLDSLGTKVSGVSITMAFGHLALQVLTLRVPSDVGPHTTITAEVRDGQWEHATHQILPVRETSVDWPLCMGLNGEAGVDAFANRFVTGEEWHGQTKPMSV